MKNFKVFFAFLFFTVGSTFFSESADEIIENYKHIAVPNFQTAILHLDNIEPDGRKDRKLLKKYTHIIEGTEEVAFDLQVDNTDRGIKFLRKAISGKTRKSGDIWIYLPEDRAPRRIKSEERYKPFAGTEFSYNQITLHDFDEETHELLADRVKITVDGNAFGGTNGYPTYNCWKIKSVPIKKSGADYAYRILWIDMESNLPVQIIYFSEKNDVLKTYSVEKIEQIKGNTGASYYLETCYIMTNSQTGRSTRIAMEKIVLDKEVPAAIFTQQWLTSGGGKRK